MCLNKTQTLSVSFCEGPQASPVVAHRVDDIKYAFFLSLLDLGTSRYSLQANVKRLLNGKTFVKPEAGVAMQVWVLIKAYVFLGRLKD